MSPSSTVLSSLIFIIHTVIANQDYFVISNDEYPLNWEEANSMCDTATTRGQLASSHNASHDTIMHDLCKSTGSDSCWIGLYRETNDNEWKWMDNSELSHTPNSITSDNTLKSCISLITSSDQPTWSDGDCLESLSSAICSTCGNINEYCCNIGDQCNGDNMECIDNQCMELMTPESTDYYFPKPTTSYYFVGTTPKKGLHIDHPSTVAIVVVVVVVIVFNVICCAIKKRKQKMIDDYEYEEHKKELEKATLNRVKSNETPGEDEKDEKNESDIRMDMDADTDEAQEEEQKYYED